MATEIYIGVNGVARRVKSVFCGVNGLARRVTHGYVGVNGVARRVMGFFKVRFWSAVAGSEGTTIDEVFTGRQNGEWRLYMKSTCSYNTNTGRAYARCRLSGYDFVAGSTLAVNFTASGTGDYADVMLTFMDTSGSTLSQTQMGDATEKAFTASLPTGTAYIDFCLQDGRAGQTEMEMIIHSLTIGGVTFL